MSSFQNLLNSQNALHSDVKYMSVTVGVYEKFTLTPFFSRVTQLVAKGDMLPKEVSLDTAGNS